MSYSAQAMQYQLMQIIKQLKAAGIDDITTEDVSLKHSVRGKLVVRFNTEEQWLDNPENKASAAQKVMKQAYKGCKLPDCVVEYEKVKYLVKVIK